MSKEPRVVTLLETNSDEWAKKIVEKVYIEWKTKYRESCKFGFKMFYSPVKENPDIMIIGYNPGVSKDSLKKWEIYQEEKLEKGDFSLPSEHEYLTKTYRLANKMRKFFEGSEKREQLLKESVKINLIFFRSKNVREWKKIEKLERIEIEDFCLNIVKEIIMKLKPKIILIEGIGTYRKLRKFLQIEDELKNPLYREAKWNDVKLFAIPHPTGSRIKGDDWNNIKKSFHSKMTL